MAHYSQKKNLFPMQGGCPCGHTRYQLNLAPIIVHCCHCASCQRQTGSAFAINAVVEADAVTPLGPEPAFSITAAGTSLEPCGVMPAFARLTGAAPVSPVPTAAARDDEGGTAKKLPPTKPDLITIPSPSKIGLTLAQCPVCHTVLWNYYCGEGSHAAYLRVGTLDAPWEIDPDVHIFTSTRRKFVALDDGKPQFEEYYPSRAELCRDEVLPRLEAIEEASAGYRAELGKILGVSGT